jgi:hypothetical protein
MIFKIRKRWSLVVKIPTRNLFAHSRHRLRLAVHQFPAVM